MKRRLAALLPRKTKDRSAAKNCVDEIRVDRTAWREQGKAGRWLSSGSIGK
jgi:hypothetical protein